jgi:hypothetical protein
MELEGLLFFYLSSLGEVPGERERVGCEDFLVGFFGKGEASIHLISSHLIITLVR